MWSAFDAQVPAHRAPQGFAVGRVQLAQGQPVLRAQHRLRQRGRAGIGLRLAFRVAGADDLEPWREQRGDVGRLLRVHDARDALAPFARARGLVAGQIVAPDAGVRVEIAQRRVLAHQVREDARQHRVLEDVGEIAGVEGVAVIHDARRSSASAR